MSAWKLFKFATKDVVDSAKESFRRQWEKAKTAARRAWNWFKDCEVAQAFLIFAVGISFCAAASLSHQKHQRQLAEEKKIETPIDRPEVAVENNHGVINVNLQ